MQPCCCTPKAEILGEQSAFRKLPRLALWGSRLMSRCSLVRTPMRRLRWGMLHTRRQPRSTAIWNTASANFPPLVAAYPHATDEEARQAQLGLERDLRFGWDMWAGRGCKPEPGRAPSFTTRFDSSRRSRPIPFTRVGARATSPNSGTSSTTWISRLETGLRQIGSWLRRCPATGLTSRDRAIPTARVFPRGQSLPMRRARFGIWVIRSPLAALRASMD